MADAANAMRRIQRNIDRRIARSKRRARSHAVRHIDYDYEPPRTEFPCAYLCGACGYYVDDISTDGESVESCPSCGYVEWIDLAVEPVADRMRDMETEERMKPPKSIRYAVMGSVVSVFVAVIVGLVIAELPGYALVSVFAAMFCVPAVYKLAPRPLSVWLLRGRERTPHRWHVPMSLPSPDRTAGRTLQGLEARAVDDTLTAPISRRECLAYQVCVLFDTPGDARPPEWALQEQRAVDIRLGEELDISSSAFYLESPVEWVDAAANDEEDPHYADIKRFLRQRGLFITDGEFHFYEARLEPGDEVDAADYDGEVYVVRHVSAANPDELPKLPQPK